MSDELRTRIAAVLPKIFDRIADGELVEWGDMADAVIRELNLRVVIVGDFQIAIKGRYAREFPND